MGTLALMAVTTTITAAVLLPVALASGEALFPGTPVGWLKLFGLAWISHAGGQGLIAYALAHRDEAVRYAMQFGPGLDREHTDRFVSMYVNELTLDYGVRGREAVRRLLAEAGERGLTPRVEVEFAE